MALPLQRRRTFAACQAIKAATGLRSGLEVAVRDSLVAQGCPFLYEPCGIPYSNPNTYHPDFVLEKQGFIIEAKGEFKTEDRRKMLLVKAQYPHLDIRFIFSRSSSRTGKQSKTTYGDWCKRHGFPYADGTVPLEWLAHKPTPQTKKELAKLLGAKATQHSHGNP